MVRNLVRGVFVCGFITGKLNCKLQKSGKYWFSHCPELDIASQGLTKEEAVENLKFTIQIHAEDRDSKIHNSMRNFMKNQIKSDLVNFSVGVPDIANVTPCACKN